MANYNIRICLIDKRIYLSYYTVEAIGMPTHLSFWYDENGNNLIVSAGNKDDMDAYEISPYFWKNRKHACRISRIAFLKTLQDIAGWEDGGRYLLEGKIINSETGVAAAFNLEQSIRFK